MSEILIDPDIETAVIVYLNTALAEIEGESATASDKTHDKRCVRVILVGGQGRVARVLTPFLLAFDSYDVTEKLAGRLAALVGGLILALEGTVISGVVVAAVTAAGAAANLPDPLDDRPRYSQAITIRARAQAL